MKKRNIIKILILLSFFALFNLRTGCYKENIEEQVRMQDALVIPVDSGECWVLALKLDSEVYKYYVKYYTFRTKLVPNGDGNYSWYYADHKKEYREFDKDWFGELKTDNDPTDCSNEDMEPNHLFFRVVDFPNLKRKSTHEVRGTAYRNKVSDASNPSIKDTGYYYYEELYFELSGRFKKKIFLGPTCQVIELKGNWYFRTPFAKFEINSYGPTGEKSTDIILDYDQAPFIGVPPFGNIYSLSFSDEYEFMYLRQNTKEAKTLSRVLRGNYTRARSHIYYSPNLDAIHNTVAQDRDDIEINGKVINHWSDLCGFIVSARGDLIQIEDSLEMEQVRNIVSFAGYHRMPIRCSIPTSSNCPLYCGLTTCGNFISNIFDDDNQHLGSHNSAITVSADSTILTISNFANLGQPLTVKMAHHAWVSCYNYDNFTITLGGKQIDFETFNVQSNGLGSKWLQANFKLDNQKRYIKYTL